MRNSCSARLLLLSLRYLWKSALTALRRTTFSSCEAAGISTAASTRASERISAGTTPSSTMRPLSRSRLDLFGKQPGRNTPKGLSMQILAIAIGTRTLRASTSSQTHTLPLTDLVRHTKGEPRQSSQPNLATFGTECGRRRFFASNAFFRRWASASAVFPFSLSVLLSGVSLSRSSATLFPRKLRLLAL